MMRLLLAGCLLAALPLHGDEWLRAVKIALDPAEDGQQIVTICITPNKTFAYDQLVFDCVYHQQFPWKDELGRTLTKVVEPVAFTYRRGAVRLTADLDAYVSFRVPVSHARLADAYCPTTFATNAPILIDRVRIAGQSGDPPAPLWQVELKAPGHHTNFACAAAAAPPPKPKGGKFGQVDLD